MSYIATEMLKKGYLLYPKALFEEQMNFKMSKKAESFFEAFLMVLTHANYSTVSCKVRVTNPMERIMRKVITIIASASATKAD